jgi:hypothetical protein
LALREAIRAHVTVLASHSRRGHAKQKSSSKRGLDEGSNHEFFSSDFMGF